MLVDYKNREIKLGQKVKVVKDVRSIYGMIYQDQIVKIDEINDEKIRVKCPLGKIYWISPSHVSASFL